MTDAHSAEWFQAVLNAMSEFVLVKGDQSRLLWANDAFLAYYGMTNKELAGLIDAEHADPDDTLQYVRDDNEVFTTGRRLDRVEAVTDSTGIVGYFNTVKTPLMSSDGTIVGTVGSSRPVSDEEVESSQQERQQRKEKMTDLRALVTNIPMAVALLDVEQRVVAVSRAWTHLFSSTGGKAGDAYAETFGTLFDLQSTFQKSINEAQTISIEDFECRVPGQGACKFQIHVEPFRLPSGEVGGVTALLHDVTDLRKKEAALARANDELSQFNYRVSHDIKAPLQSILGLAGVCLDEIQAGENPVVDDVLGRLKDSAEQLAELVENLMVLARADIDERDNEDCDIADVIDQSLRRHATQIKEQGIRVDLDLQVRMMRTQRIRLSQCIENLISNAVKYIDPHEAEPRITLRSHKLAQTVTIRVTDNGSGMDTKTASRVFEQFFRGSGKPGTGLGLYIVSKHIARLGGTVEVSHCAKPTEFTMSLPEG